MAHVTPYKLQIQKQLMQPIIDLVKFYLIGNATPHPKKWTQNRKYTYSGTDENDHQNK